MTTKPKQIKAWAIIDDLNGKPDYKNIDVEAGFYPTKESAQFSLRSGYPNDKHYWIIPITITLPSQSTKV